MLDSETALECRPVLSIPSGTSSSSSSSIPSPRNVLLGLRIPFLKAAADTLADEEIWSSREASEAARLIGRDRGAAEVDLVIGSGPVAGIEAVVFTGEVSIASDRDCL
jgi:hypothetical protein